MAIEIFSNDEEYVFVDTVTGTPFGIVMGKDAEDFLISLEEKDEDPRTFSRHEFQYEYYKFHEDW